MAKKRAPLSKRPRKPSAADIEQLENVKREAFCRYYAQGEGTFGNATLSYAAAYDIELRTLTMRDRDFRLVHYPSNFKVYDMCSAAGSRLLRDVKVQERVRVLLNELLKDEIVDAELAKVIKQDGELAPKVAAMKEYNKLRKRVDDKPLITINTVDAETQKLIDSAMRSYLTHAPQGNTGQ